MIGQGRIEPLTTPTVGDCRKWLPPGKAPPFVGSNLVPMRGDIWRRRRLDPRDRVFKDRDVIYLANNDKPGRDKAARGGTGAHRRCQEHSHCELSVSGRAIWPAWIFRWGRIVRCTMSIMLWFFESLLPRSFRLVLIDPPWEF